MHSSGQGALIKTHCLYSLQEASSRPRCSPDVHPRHPPPRNSIPRGSLFGQLPSKSFETILRPRFFAMLSFSLFISFLRAIPCFLAKTFLVKEEGARRSCVPCSSIVWRGNRGIVRFRIAERRSLLRERDVDAVILKQWGTWLARVIRCKCHVERCVGK